MNAPHFLVLCVITSEANKNRFFLYSFVIFLFLFFFANSLFNFFFFSTVLLLSIWFVRETRQMTQSTKIVKYVLSSWVMYENANLQSSHRNNTKPPPQPLPPPPPHFCSLFRSFVDLYRTRLRTNARTLSFISFAKQMGNILL